LGTVLPNKPITTRPDVSGDPSISISKYTLLVIASASLYYRKAKKTSTVVRIAFVEKVRLASFDIFARTNLDATDEREYKAITKRVARIDTIIFMVLPVIDSCFFVL
jgi:hypothetical protein